MIYGVKCVFHRKGIMSSFILIFKGFARNGLQMQNERLIKKQVLYNKYPASHTDLKMNKVHSSNKSVILFSLLSKVPAVGVHLSLNDSICNCERSDALI